MEVIFGEWLPDLPDYKNPGLVIAKNCIPEDGYYKPVNAIVETTTSALDSQCTGVFAGQANDLTSFVVAGTSAKLWKLKSDNTFEDISIAGGYNGSTEDCWQFVQYQNRIIATNFVDAVQSYVIGSSTDFANLGGSPPKGKSIAEIRGFIVLGGTDTSPYQVAWSDFANPTTWSGGLANTYTVDADAGPIINIVGGEYGVIFCERAIFRMNYIGAPFVFEFSRVEKETGLLACNAVKQVGGLIFYLGQAGFFWFDGNQSKNISASKVSNFFLRDVDLRYSSNISCAYDYQKNIIFILYSSQSAIGGIPNRMLIYNVNDGRWAYVDSITAERVFINRTYGYTIASVDAIYPTIDDIPFVFDSLFWLGGAVEMAAISINHRMANFSGDPLTAQFETGEFPVEPNAKRTNLIWAKPLAIDQTGATIAMSYRNNLGSPATTLPETALNSAGLFPIRTNGVYLKARLTVPGGFDSVQGIELLTGIKGSLQ